MSLLKTLRNVLQLYSGCGELRFSLRWPDRKDNYCVRVRTRGGDFAADVRLRRCTSDVQTFSQIFLKRAYDLGKLPRACTISSTYTSILAHATPLIVDLGANIGLASLYLTSCWPKSRIIAVEPAEDNFALLCSNAASFPNIKPVLAGIAAEKGTIRITNHGAQPWAYRTEVIPDTSAGTRALSMSEILECEPYCAPFIAKIDIEGFERNLFSKNVEWVEKFPILVIELHDWLFPGSGNSRNFLKTISSLDRDFFFYGENVFSIANDPT